MEISDIIKKKEELQHDISTLLCRFTCETECNIHNIEIDEMKEIMSTKNVAYITKIRIYI